MKHLKKFEATFQSAEGSGQVPEVPTGRKLRPYMIKNLKPEMGDKEDPMGMSDESKTYTKDEVINLIFDYQKKELGKFNSNTDEEWNFTDPNGYNYVSLDRIKSKIVQFMENK